MRTLRHTHPETPSRLTNDFERALQNWWLGKDPFELMTSGEWQVHIDVAESDESFEVKVDLPGMDPEDVELTVHDRQLTIQGERKEKEEKQEKTRHHIERRYGSFRRTITLPAGAMEDGVTAVADNGVTTITVPKAAAVKAKRVAVNPR